MDLAVDQPTPAPGASPAVAPFEKLTTLTDLLANAVADNPNAPAITFEAQRRGPVTLTYRQLWEQARAAAAALRASGIRAQDRVLLVQPTSVDFVSAFFGAVLIGAIPVPMAPPFSLKERDLNAYVEALSRSIRDSGATSCVVPPKLRLVLHGAFRALDRNLKILSSAGLVGSAMLPVEEIAKARADDTAFLQYTSGSTSDPKGVELTHGNLIANVRAIARALYRPDQRQCTVSWLPLYHDMGLIGTLFVSLSGQRQLVLIPPLSFLKDPACWLRAISDYQATITVAPNFAFGYCAKVVEPEDLEGVSLSTLDTMLNGAEPIDMAAVDRFQEAFAPWGLPRDIVRPVYGLAESSLAVTFSEPGPCRIDRVDANQLEVCGRALPVPGEDRARVVVSVGRPLATQEVAIFDEEDRPLSERQVGEIVVRGPSVMKGYFRRADASEKTLRGGWLHTGDLGYLADGELYIVGRKKDVLILRGRNYYPQDIEFVVAGLDGVRKGGVVAFAVDGDGDQQVVVAVETRIEHEDERSQLERRIREQVMRSFNLPIRELLLLEPGSIPKSTSGKVRRQPCRALYQRQLLGARMESNRLNVALATRVARSSVSRVVDYVSGVAYRLWRRDGESQCA